MSKQLNDANPKFANEICDDANHQWMVFSTALAEHCLMLNCSKCGAEGTVNDPTKKEWRQASLAPSKPYDWPDNSRVTFQYSNSRYTERAPGNGLPGMILIPDRPLTNDERDELKALERFVIEEGLDGDLFSFLIRITEEAAVLKPGDAAKRLAARIEELANQGRRFSPAMIAIIIRDHLRGS